jgi:hypothetical protein
MLGMHVFDSNSLEWLSQAVNLFKNMSNQISNLQQQQDLLEPTHTVLEQEFLVFCEAQHNRMLSYLFGWFWRSRSPDVQLRSCMMQLGFFRS